MTRETMSNQIGGMGDFPTKGRKKNLEGEDIPKKKRTRKSVPVSFKIDIETLRMLESYCLTKGLPRSAVVREAIQELLEEGVKTKPKKLWGNGVQSLVKMNKDLFRQVDEFAKKNKMNRSMVIRLAILQFLQKYFNSNSEVKVGSVKL